MEHNERVAHISNGSLHYWVYNLGKPQTLLMIHGFTGDHHGFVKLLPMLSDYEIIVPDLPGSGKSDLPARHDWNIDSIAQLTNEFVSSLNLPKPPIIFGHSMGALVVASMIHQAPHLYSQKVILLSPVPRKVTLFDARFIGARCTELRLASGYKIPLVGDKLIKSSWATDRVADILMTTKDPETMQFIYQQMRDDMARINNWEFFHVLQNDINRRGTIDYGDALSKKELLIISGDKDLVVPPKYVAQLAQNIGATLKMIPGVGHNAQYEKANDVIRHILPFLKKAERMPQKN